MVTGDWLQNDQQSATACCTWRSGCLIRSKAGAQSCSNFSRVITILLGNGCGQTDAMSTVAFKLLESFLCRTAFSTRRGSQCCNAYSAVQSICWIQCIVPSTRQDGRCYIGWVMPARITMHVPHSMLYGTCSDQPDRGQTCSNHTRRTNAYVLFERVSHSHRGTFALSHASHNFVPSSS